MSLPDVIARSNTWKKSRRMPCMTAPLSQLSKSRSSISLLLLSHLRLSYTNPRHTHAHAHAHPHIPYIPVAARSAVCQSQHEASTKDGLIFGCTLSFVRALSRRCDPIQAPFRPIYLTITFHSTLSQRPCTSSTLLSPTRNVSLPSSRPPWSNPTPMSSKSSTSSST